MQLHNTKGIVLRTVKYGDSGIITTVYTELFGVQSYIVKGVRQSSKKSQGKANYFQPSAMLDMTVYHNQMKHLQFIKDYNWAYLYENVLFDVVKNTVAMYIIELLQHSLKQPEANPELFYLIEDSLMQLDKGSPTLTANLPLYFTLHLASELGFAIQGDYSSVTPILDLAEGSFIETLPNHQHYVTNDLAKLTSQLNSINFYNELENIKLNITTRRQLSDAYLQFLALHVSDFGELKSLSILQEILS